MAFEGLLAWAKALVRQAARVSEAQDRLKDIVKEFPPEPGHIFNAEPIRGAGHVSKPSDTCFALLLANFLTIGDG